MSTRVQNLANGGAFHYSQDGKRTYLPSKKTQERIGAIKARLSSNVPSQKKIESHLRQRRLFKFNDCEAGSKLIDMIMQSGSRRFSGNKTISLIPAA
jgi:hypothetical protein